MEALTYLLKVTACTILFFGFYLLFLRKLTFFKINRFYLLLTLLLSFIIPVLQFEIKREIVVTDTQVSANVPEMKPVNPAPVQLIQPVMLEYDQQAKPEINWSKMIFGAYVGIASLLLLICLWRLFNLLKHTSRYTKNSDGLKLISKSAGFTNCSFFNYVFIDERNINQADLAVLLKHEQVHARQYHSIDKMMLMVFKSILWFNPIVYLYDKALEQVHEYEADEMTSNGFGNEAYANLLLKLAIAKSDMPLIHNFVKSPIKDRIKMLFHKKSKNMKKLMYLLALPVALGLFWLFAVQVVYAQDISKAQQKKNRELPLPNVKQTNPYFNSPEYLEKKKISEEISGKTLIGVLGARYKEKTQIPFAEGIIFTTDKYKLLLTSDYFLGKGLDELKLNDKVEVKVSGTYFSAKNNSLICLIPETIKREDKIIYQKPKSEVYPFLYEGNRVRFNDGKISAIKSAGDKKIISVSANGFDFRITVDATQTDLAYFNDYRVGDEVRLRFVHEVKSGTNSYAINDWISISKNIRTFGVQNKKLFTKFYKEDGHQRVAVKNQPVKVSGSVEPKIISFSKLTGDVKHNVSYMENAVIDISNNRLEAMYVELDKPNGKMVAKNASLKDLKENIILKSSLITFDLKKGGYNFNVGKGLTQTNNDIEKLTNSISKGNFTDSSKVEYSARDSVKMSKDRSIIYLFGNAKILYNKTMLSGSKIVYNKIKSSLLVNNATMTSSDNKVVKADSLYFDLKTAKAKLYGADFKR